jgi:hypothetical protein
VNKLFGLLLFVIGSLNQTLATETMQTNIQDVKIRHQSRLMSMSGVISVGIGLDENKNPVIIIGIETDDAELISRLPQQLEGYQVRVQKTGKIRIQ